MEESRDFINRINPERNRAPTTGPITNVLNSRERAKRTPEKTSQGKQWVLRYLKRQKKPPSRIDITGRKELTLVMLKK